MLDYTSLTDIQSAEILKEMIKRFKTGEGRIYGCNQLIEMAEDIAIEKHFVKCPLCKR